MITWDEVYKRFKEPFPPEALSIDNSRGFPLTSIKAQFIVDKLNTVLGLKNWVFDGVFKECTGGVIFNGALKITVNEETAIRHADGFSIIKKNLGDTYKSARTDALSKAASLYSIGDEIFKGMHEQAQSQPRDNDSKVFDNALNAIKGAKTKAQLDRYKQVLPAKKLDKGKLNYLQKIISERAIKLAETENKENNKA